MDFGLSRVLHGVSELMSRAAAPDEHLLAGADEASVQALGASAPVLSIFPQDVATLCPDLVHEAQLGVGRKD